MIVLDASVLIAYLDADDQHHARAEDLLEEVAREHEPLVDAIEARDEATAARTMEQHILSTIGAVITRLGGDPKTLLTPL